MASRSSKTGLLQSCFMLQCNVPQREKSTLFPKTQKDKKTPYDFEAEFGKRPKKVFPERVESPSSYAKMPFSQPLIIDTVGSILSEYIPVEKKALVISPAGMKQRWEALKMLLISTYSLGVIRKNTKSFKARPFADNAQKTFIEVNMALQENDKQKLKDLVIRSVYVALKQQFWDSNQRIHWRFIKTINRPRVVHARIAPVEEKQNLFGQVTVKMHTEQILAVTDQHGRRLKGDKQKSKEVIEYVVFERHLVNPYGQWKIVGKVIPPQQIPNSQITAPSQPAQLARP